jgi:hypothetical protein
LHVNPIEEPLYRSLISGGGPSEYGIGVHPIKRFRDKIMHGVPSENPYDFSSPHPSLMKSFNSKRHALIIDISVSFCGQFFFFFLTCALGIAFPSLI